jgi:hypothetical protein
MNIGQGLPQEAPIIDFGSRLARLGRAEIGNRGPLGSRNLRCTVEVAAPCSLAQRQAILDRLGQGVYSIATAEPVREQKGDDNRLMLINS